MNRVLELATSTGEPCLDPSELRRAMGTFPTGAVVVTALSERAGPIGQTINSFNSVSLDPPLVLWTLSRDSGLFSDFAACERFTINLLANDQDAVCRRFDSDGPDAFVGVDWTFGIGGTPRVSDAIAYFDCSVFARYEHADHDLFIGKIEDFSHQSGTPLMLHRGAMCRLEGIDH